MFQMRKKRIERSSNPAAAHESQPASRRVSDIELLEYMKKTQLLPNEFDS